MVLKERSAGKKLRRAVKELRWGKKRGGPPFHPHKSWQKDPPRNKTRRENVQKNGDEGAGEGEMGKKKQGQDALRGQGATLKGCSGPARAAKENELR